MPLSRIISHQNRVTPEILELLTNTTIGTNGAKYRHLHTVNKIGTLYRPHFYSIIRHQKALANVTICNRPTLLDGDTIETFYIRYFAFASSYQTKGASQKINTTKPSIFEVYLSDLFSTTSESELGPAESKSFFWAFIDPENNRSLNMADRFKFETIGQFKTFGFSRFFPKVQPKVERLKAVDKAEVLQQIKTFYQHHALFSEVHLFKHDDYFVYRHEGKIVAGVQVYKVHWKIEAMPGLKGKVMVKVLPYIPILNRIINPKNYRFLATEGLFWEDGHEDKIEKLLEGVLHSTGHQSLLIWVDIKDKKLISGLKSQKLGWIQRVKSDNTIDVLGRFNRFPESVQSKIINSPKYISGFDTT